MRVAFREIVLRLFGQNYTKYQRIRSIGVVQLGNSGAESAQTNISHESCISRNCSASIRSELHQISTHTFTSKSPEHRHLAISATQVAPKSLEALVFGGLLKFWAIEAASSPQGFKCEAITTSAFTSRPLIQDCP
ncbi:hypothetical protein Tcan_13397 [Toxocara canis]|uniref:Uncharacterized protein n=1 Tax=Toxocara canis TaxID=6265 RepID=A0A0B2UPD2_TOXCA|nr:hypothetical protein Tcan_13397 [Toxocara canis]